MNLKNIFKKRKPTKQVQKRKSELSQLTPIERKKLKKKLDKLQNKKNRIPRSVQQSIPYIEMYRDGICKVEEEYFTMVMQFGDINYQLAKLEDKEQIFDAYCDLLNYFDDTIKVQLTFMNLSADSKEYSSYINISEQNDDFNEIRNEYSQMLHDQLDRGNNGLVRVKYVTFGIKEKDRKIAKSKLEHIEAEVKGNFKRIGVSCSSLNGAERLRLLHRVFHIGTQESFVFDWNYRVYSGLSTKDFIAPNSLNFTNYRKFKMGDIYGASFHIDLLASEISDGMLADYLDIDENLIFNIHLNSVDHITAMKFVKRKMSNIDAMKVDEQKKAARSGYDIDILPPDLVTYSKEIQKMLDDLQSKNERMYNITITITAFAKTSKKLDLITSQISNVTQKNACKLKPLDYAQEDGLMSSLPLGINRIERNRILTTSSVGVFVPFTTQELFQKGGIYYGRNAVSNNMILADRKLLKNPNGLLLGTPGSGKSFSAKREIANVFLSTDDSIIICDPEGEYFPLVNEFGGQHIRISPNSEHHINPMDINIDYADDEDPVIFKSDFIISLCELIVGGKHGLQPIEISLIDRCIHKVYEKYFRDPRPENMPILGDLYQMLLNSPEAEAKYIASALEIYVTGSLKIFNNRTNVDINNRIVCFDIKELGKQLRKIGMLIVQDQVWNKVTENRNAMKTTRYYIDEFHLLLKEEQTAAYSVEIWKRFRKWGGIPTGITQNVKDLLSSKQIENILDNSDFLYMLNQASGDREILAQKLGISEYQLSYVTNSNQGEGLIFYGNVILPFVDRFPKDTKLYSIMTTKLEEQQPQTI